MAALRSELARLHVSNSTSSAAFTANRHGSSASNTDTSPAAVCSRLYVCLRHPSSAWCCVLHIVAWVTANACMIGYPKKGRIFFNNRMRHPIKSVISKINGSDIPKSSWVLMMGMSSSFLLLRQSYFRVIARHLLNALSWMAETWQVTHSYPTPKDARIPIFWKLFQKIKALWLLDGETTPCPQHSVVGCAYTPVPLSTRSCEFGDSTTKTSVLKSFPASFTLNSPQV